MESTLTLALDSLRSLDGLFDLLDDDDDDDEEEEDEEEDKEAAVASVVVVVVDWLGCRAAAAKAERLAV